MKIKIALLSFLCINTILLAMEPENPGYWDMLPPDARLEIIMQSETFDDALTLFSKLMSSSKELSQDTSLKKKFIQQYIKRLFEESLTLDFFLLNFAKLIKTIDKKYINKAELIKKVHERFGKEYNHTLITFCINMLLEKDNLDDALSYLEKEWKRINPNVAKMKSIFEALGKLYNRIPYAVFNHFANNSKQNLNAARKNIAYDPNEQKAFFEFTRPIGSGEEFDAFIEDASYLGKKDKYSIVYEVYKLQTSPTVYKIAWQWLADYVKKASPEEIKKMQATMDLSDFGIPQLWQYIYNIASNEITDENIAAMRSLINLQASPIDQDLFECSLDIALEKIDELYQLKAKTLKNSLEYNIIAHKIEQWQEIATLLIDEGAPIKKKILKKYGIDYKKKKK